MDSLFLHHAPDNRVAAEGHPVSLKIAVQANISVAEWPADAGSRALSNFKALEDATIVNRLKQAGAHICGSTRTSEFGFSLHNSQAGEAIRKQAADAELVLDLMGESRLAACRAHVFGFKPSWGLVSRYGIIGLIPSMECCGVLARNPADLRFILKNIAGPDERDYSQPPESIPDFSPQKIDPAGISIGVVTEARDLITEGQAETFSSSLKDLEKAGFSLHEISLPEFPLLALVHKIVGSVEASSCAGRYDSVRYGPRVPGAKNWNEMYLLSRGAAFGALIKSYLFQGAFFQFERYKAYQDACRIRARLLKEVQQLATQVDFLVLPAADKTASNPPESPADPYAQFDLTLFANVTGQPVLYLPAPEADHGGIQISGARLSDSSILDLGEHLLNLRQGGKQSGI